MQFSLEKVNKNLVWWIGRLNVDQGCGFPFPLQVRNETVISENAPSEKETRSLLPGQCLHTSRHFSDWKAGTGLHADTLIASVSHHNTVGEFLWGKFRDFCEAQLRKTVSSWISANSQSYNCVRKLTLPSELVWGEEIRTWSRPSLYFDKLMGIWIHTSVCHRSASYGGWAHAMNSCILIT